MCSKPLVFKKSIDLLFGFPLPRLKAYIFGRAWKYINIDYSIRGLFIDSPNYTMAITFLDKIYISADELSCNMQYVVALLLCLL